MKNNTQNVPRVQDSSEPKKRRRRHRKSPTAKANAKETQIFATISLIEKQIDEKKREEVVDFTGQECWQMYRLSKVGFALLFMLPSDTVRGPANQLFDLGFSAGMSTRPQCDTITDDTAIANEKTWKGFLDSMDGKIILHGDAWPNTPEVVLRYAKEFFFAGFNAGTISVQEILKL